jgi:hypothetical protein
MRNRHNRLQIQAIYSALHTFELQGGGFIVKRPKDFAEMSFQHFNSEPQNFAATLTRQANLYQFIYVQPTGISRRKIWLSNTLGRIGGFVTIASAFSTARMQQLGVLVVILQCVQLPIRF